MSALYSVIRHHLITSANSLFHFTLPHEPSGSQRWMLQVPWAPSHVWPNKQIGNEKGHKQIFWGAIFSILQMIKYVIGLKKYHYICVCRRLLINRGNWVSRSYTVTFHVLPLSVRKNKKNLDTFYMIESVVFIWPNIVNCKQQLRWYCILKGFCVQQWCETFPLQSAISMTFN